MSVNHVSGNNQENILKTRDDYKPIHFKADSTAGEFKIIGEQECSWAKEMFHGKILRQRIEPWLTSLFQSEHLSLLVGSGLMHAVHYLATGESAAGMDPISFDSLNDEIAKQALLSSKKAGRKDGNIEDQLRVANELLCGLQILKDERASQLSADINSIMNNFAESILKSEMAIATADSHTREQALNTLVNFLMSFASRVGTRDRLNVFTTNYDRLIEAGAELAGLHLLDRFLGTLMPLFRSSRMDLDMHYNPPGIRGEPRYLEGVVRFTKLHGSIDWVRAGKDIRRIGLPFGSDVLEPYLNAPGLEDASAHELMIFPNAAKDQETAQYPYVELFRDLAATTCRPNNTLVTYGYSFGDEHINRIIKDMLTIPSTHLVVISFNDPLGRIMQTYEELGRPSQITLLIGPELGDLKNLVDHYLPKAAIDRATFRMSELLKARYGTKQESDNSQSEGDELQ